MFMMKWWIQSFTCSIFKECRGQEILNNAFIWYLPKKDVNKVKDVWKEARKVIKGGIKLQQKLSHDRNGRLIFVYENNFRKQL